MAPAREPLRARFGPWAVVTGASAGLGRAYALALAAGDVSVILVARRASLLRVLAEECRRAYGVDTRVVDADLATAAGIDAVVDAAAGLDVGLLVNNAGAAAFGSFFADTVNTHAGILALNVAAPVALTRALVAPMRTRRRGAVLFVGSTASVLVPYFATYAASKRALAAFAALLRYELRPFGVNVLVVEPGLVDTDAARRLQADVDLSRIAPPPLPPAVVARKSLARIGHRATYTPGFAARAAHAAARLIPPWTRFRLVGAQLRGAMSPKIRAGLD